MKPLFIFHGFKKNINYVLRLFNNNGSIKKWHKFKRKYRVHQKSYFQWVQLINSIPEKWKFIVKKNNEVSANLITHDIIKSKAQE